MLSVTYHILHITCTFLHYTYRTPAQSQNESTAEGPKITSASQGHISPRLLQLVSPWIGNHQLQVLNSVHTSSFQNGEWGVHAFLLSGDEMKYSAVVLEANSQSDDGAGLHSCHAL